MAFELVGLDLVDFPSADPGRELVVPVLVLVGFNTPEHRIVIKITLLQTRDKWDLVLK